TNDGPFYEMCSLAGAGVAIIPWQMLLATIAPVLFGMLLGNLDKKMAKFLEPGIFISIFLFSFPLGCGLNFGKAIAAGGPGVLLALLTLLITGVGGYFLYMIFIPKKHRVTCVPGAAVGSIAGNAVATPAAIASADPRFAPVLESATIQVVAAILICAVCCPILCNFLFKLEEKATGHKINLEGVDYTEEEHKI
ncbi:MAG: 2-keto-3-deoxygluconate permease, partial [Synergistaceae bacterium]|nr:2-keto-3-deoxygluconate permease [Synergistaceae bacterium]